jgi:hypothetical protein
LWKACHRRLTINEKLGVSCAKLYK